MKVTITDSAGRILGSGNLASYIEAAQTEQPEDSHQAHQAAGLQQLIDYTLSTVRQIEENAMGISECKHGYRYRDCPDCDGHKLAEACAAVNQDDEESVAEPC